MTRTADGTRLTDLIAPAFYPVYWDVKEGKLKHSGNKMLPASPFDTKDRKEDTEWQESLISKEPL